MDISETSPDRQAESAAAPRSLVDRYRSIRRRSVYLTRSLAPEDQVVQSMPDVSPTKWHLAHTTWFFETFVLAPFLPGYALHDPRYPFLFNSYYVQAGERHCRAQRGYLSRPTVDEVRAYREHVDAAMETFLEESCPPDPDVRELVELGLNHEQQHQELILTDLKHVFAVNPLRPAYLEVGPEPPSKGVEPQWSAPHQMPRGPHEPPPVPHDPSGPPRREPPEDPPMGWAEFDEGVHSIGHDGNGFSYDNERPRHRRFLEPFALATRLTTNREFLAFMEDGGYRRPELWMSEGWARLQEHGWTEPFYWERRDGGWWTFTLSGMRPVDPGEPVCHVNWYEADAFARWAGARLPREEEWEVAAAPYAIEGNFVDAGRFHPAPAAGRDPSPAAGRSPASERPRILQLFGDVWEWTSSSYSPYPGFRPAPGAVGEYNGKFMVNQYVLRGGSCATSRSHIRVSYRNFFPPDASWQFTGIRLARDPVEADTGIADRVGFR